MRCGTLRPLPRIATLAKSLRVLKGRRAVPDAIAKSPGYAISQIVRKRIEEIFGWAKQIDGMAQVKLCGTAKVDWRFLMTLAAYNLTRLYKLPSPSTGQVFP